MAPEYPDAKRKLLERYLRGELSIRPEARRIPRRKPGEAIPLSHAQEQVWLHAQMAPDLPLYNEPVTIHYSGQLDVGILRRSFNEILRRHEAWRTAFREVDGRPVQEVQENVSLSIPFVDLSALPRELREATALEVATAEAKVPLDLSQAPLLRATLVRLDTEVFRLYLTLHHIIFDGVAIYGVFLQELTALYKAFAEGKASPLPELATQYPDYACWERQTVTRESLKQELERIRQRLPGKSAGGIPPDGSSPSQGADIPGLDVPIRVATAAHGGAEGILQK